jgi:hypothetical protein
VLTIFKKAEYGPISRPTSISNSGMSAIPSEDWQRIGRLMDAVLDRHDQKKADKLMNTVTTLTAELNLQKTINEGLESALLNEKKRHKRGRNVFEELRAEDGVCATSFCPKKI